MAKKDTVIESEELIKDILNRLENNRENIYIVDTTDNSNIAMGNEIINLMKTFYRVKLVNNGYSI